MQPLKLFIFHKGIVLSTLKGVDARGGNVGTVNKESLSQSGKHRHSIYRWHWGVE